jgi:hypothetical protein
MLLAPPPWPPQVMPARRCHELKLLAAGCAVRPPDLQGHCRSVQFDMGHCVDALIALAFVFEARHYDRVPIAFSTL